MFQQVQEFTLVRVCLHKSQQQQQPKKGKQNKTLITTMDDMNPKAMNVLKFKTIICISY